MGYLSFVFQCSVFHLSRVFLVYPAILYHEYLDLACLSHPQVRHLPLHLHPLRRHFLDPVKLSYGVGLHLTGEHSEVCIVNINFLIHLEKHVAGASQGNVIAGY